MIVQILQTNCCSVIENASTSVFAFMIGMLLSDKEDNIIIGGCVAFVGIMSFSIASILTDGNNISVCYCSCFVKISMTYLFAYILQKLNIRFISKVLGAIGAYSLELYITSVFVIEVIDYYLSSIKPLYRLLLILSVGAIMSLFLKATSERILKLLLRVR